MASIRSNRSGIFVRALAGVGGPAVLAAALLAVIGSSAAHAQTGPCGTAGVLSSTNTCTYTAANGQDTFVVPSGVSAITVIADGAAGGNCQNCGLNGSNLQISGGPGGEYRATLSAANLAGTTLSVFPGGAGVSSTGGLKGGSGGAASTVATAADLLLVAGGGGGASLADGGAGGGSASEDGGTKPNAMGAGSGGQSAGTGGNGGQGFALGGSPGNNGQSGGNGTGGGGGAGSGGFKGGDGGQTGDPSNGTGGGGGGSSNASVGGQGGSVLGGLAGGSGDGSGGAGGLPLLSFVNLAGAGGGGGGYSGGGGGAVGGPGGGGSAYPASATTIGGITVTPDSTDTNSNSAAGSVTISWTVDDDLALTNVPANIATDATGPSGATVTYAPPGASDADDATAPPVSCSPQSGSTFAIGTTIVTCSASDGDDAGSPVSATFTVTVKDTDLALIGGPSNMTVVPTSAKGAVVTFTPPSAVDEGGESPTVGCVPASGSLFPIATTTVTCTATDSDDLNSPVTTTFTVTVDKAPTVLSASPQLVLIPPGGVGLGTVSATLTSFGQPVVARTIMFSSIGSPLCGAVTDSLGVATCSPGFFGELAVLLSDRYTAKFAGDSVFLPSRSATAAVKFGPGLALSPTAAHSHVTIARALLSGHGARYTILGRHRYTGSRLRALGLHPGRYTLTVILSSGRRLHTQITLR